MKAKLNLDKMAETMDCDKNGLLKNHTWIKLMSDYGEFECSFCEQQSNLIDVYKESSTGCNLSFNKAWLDFIEVN